MAGVGTHAKAILGSWRIVPGDNCNCESFAAEWDNRGPAWCRANFDGCVTVFQKEANARGWAMGSVAAFGGAAWVLTRAIEAAEADAARLTVDEAAFESRVADVLAAIRGDDEPRPFGWELRPEVVEAHRRLFAEHAKRKHAPPPREGRGVVMLAGGVKYFPAAFICVTRLRDVGCQLPVRLYYLGREELDHAMESALQGLGVECWDLRLAIGDRLGVTPRRLAGWESKVWALQSCGWREVLFLDADTVPVVDPTYLFDCPEYQDTGAILWPDLPNQWGTDVTETAFVVAGLPVPGRTRLPEHDKPSDYRPVESGQILVDVVRSWDALMTARHICDHSDFWFGQPAGIRHWHIYGDKSSFYLGFEATKTRYAMPPDCEWFGDRNGGGFRQRDFAGRPVIEHRCQPVTKVRYRTEPNTQGLTHPDKFTAAWNELRRVWSGELWSWRDQGPEDTAVARAMVGTSWLPFGLPFSDRVELQDGGRLRRAPRYHWRIVHTDGLPRLLLADSTRLVACLGPDDKDNWCDHGRGHYLAPAPPLAWQMSHEQFDAGVWSDIVVRNEYRLPPRFPSGAVVIDVGAHVGIFARECLERGAAHVVAAEPNHENFAKLAANLASYGERVTLIPAAVWRSDVPDSWQRLERKPGAMHSGGASVLGTTVGQLCRTVPFDSLVELARERCERVALVKLDCEGAEWPILATSRRLWEVDAACGEYHLALVNTVGADWQLPELPVGKPDDWWIHWLMVRLNASGMDHVEVIPNVPGLGWFFARFK